MSLTIESERVHALAREAARVTGKSETDVIEEALQSLLADLEKQRETQKRLEDIQDAARRWREQSTSDGPYLTIEDLYDSETGLPQ